MPFAMRTFVHRLRPSRAQHATLERMLEDQRLLYNGALEERIGAWRKAGVSITLNAQTRSLTQVRGFAAAYGGVAYNVSKWTLKRLDDAFKGFFRRAKRGGKAGFPRFRAMGRWRSFGYHQKDGLRIIGDRLMLVGMADGLRVRFHRTLPDGAALKSAVFTLENGVWRVALTMAVAIVDQIAEGEMIGIDVGVNHLATDSDGVHYANVRPRSKREAELRRAQRALARAVHGSKRRRKTRAKVRAVQRAMRNHRTTHLHDVANAIVRRSPHVAFEDLKLLNMTRSARGTLDVPGVNVRPKAGLNRALRDAAPGRLIRLTTYKAESAGGSVVRVDPRNTSRTCSACGVVDAAQAGPTRYLCGCGLDLHRDHNAALNIKERGLAARAEAARRLGDPNVAGCGVRGPVNAEPVAA
jgi:putative transposase